MSTDETTSKATLKEVEVSAEAERKEEAVVDAECTAEFKPVVQLTEVHVTTGEEDDEVVFDEQAKLYIHGETLLDEGTGKLTWRNRGFGKVRILRNPDSGRARLVMRQDKTLKVLCNHGVVPEMELQPKMDEKSWDRTWMWKATDFSDEDKQDGGVETTFAIRFKTAELAASFKDKFTECQRDCQPAAAAATEAWVMVDDANKETKTEIGELVGKLDSLQVDEGDDEEKKKDNEEE